MRNFCGEILSRWFTPRITSPKEAITISTTHYLNCLKPEKSSETTSVGRWPVNPRVLFTFFSSVFYLSNENLVPLNLLRCRSQTEVTQQYRPPCIVIKVYLKLNISALKFRCHEIKEGNQNIANNLYPKAI